MKDKSGNLATDVICYSIAIFITVATTLLSPLLIAAGVSETFKSINDKRPWMRFGLGAAALMTGYILFMLEVV